jgi:hypothetical protein
MSRKTSNENLPRGFHRAPGRGIPPEFLGIDGLSHYVGNPQDLIQLAKKTGKPPIVPHPSVRIE